jgi:hypothetical protein
MGLRLSRLLDQVDEQTTKMATKKQAVMDASNEQQAAKHLYSARVAEHEALELSQLDDIAIQLEAATSRTALARRATKAQSNAKAAELEKLQAEVDKTAKAKADRAAQAKEAKENADKAAAAAAKLAAEMDEVDSAAKVAEQALRDAAAAPGGLPLDALAGADAAGDEAHKPIPHFDVEDSEESDSEDDAMAHDLGEDEITDFESWKQAAARWVFYSNGFDQPPGDVLAFFTMVDQSVGAKLATQMVELRDACSSERTGEVADDKAISDVADKGDWQAAYTMRVARGVYSQERFNSLAADLNQKMEEAFRPQLVLREADVKKGAKTAASYKCKRVGLAEKAQKGKSSGSTGPEAQKVRAAKTHVKKKLAGGSRRASGATATEAKNED